MNPFKSWPVFVATVYATVLTTPSWWDAWWVYGPNCLVLVSWCAVPWMLASLARPSPGWLWALGLTYPVLAGALLWTGASAGGVLACASAVGCVYIAFGTRKIWKF